MDAKPLPLAFDLESTLPYLLNRAGVRIGLSFTGELARFELTLPEFRVLASLLGRETQSVSELAAGTSAELSRVSRIITTLAARRLLARRASRHDARALEVSLTAAGRALVAQIVPIAQLYERVALGGLSADEVAQLKRLLGRVYENMQGLAVPRTRRRR